MASQDNPQLLFTLSEPPVSRVQGIVMLDNFVYVIYFEYNKIEVYDCEDCYKKVKVIEVEDMDEPCDMVGSSVTSQLFISESVGNIRRVDLNTGVIDVFIKADDGGSSLLSLVENRLLVMSRDSIMIYDIDSRERIKSIPYPEEMKKDIVWQAIESNRDSFIVNHTQSDSYNLTLSEIDSEGRVIRVFNNEQQLQCVHLALDSVGRLLVADVKNCCVVLLDEHLKFERILFDEKRLESHPLKLNYNKNNNRLAVGLMIGKVMLFDCNT